MNQCPDPADQPRPVPAGDQPPHPRPAANLLRPYLRRTQDWARFDDQAARADGLSEDLLRVGREVNPAAARPPTRCVGDSGEASAGWAASSAWSSCMRASYSASDETGWSSS